MIIAKQMEIRSNIKEYFDMAYNGETIIVPRKERKNIVIISEDEYNKMRQLARINDYAERIGKVPGNVILNKNFSSKNIKEENLKKLNLFKTLKPGWDGSGAPTIPIETINKVKALVNSLPIQPELFPTTLETIQLEFNNSRHDHMEIEIGTSDVSEVFIVTHFGEELSEQISTDLASVSERIQKFYG